jgi:hypothetical protein
MKKPVLLIVLLLTSQILFGQFDFGLKLGYNASKLSTQLDSVNASYSSGFHIGVFTRIGKKFYVQPEAYYTLESSKVAGTETSWNQKLTIGSVDIPVLVGYKFLNSKAVKIRILAGPVASFVINRNVKDLGDVTGPVKEADINNVNWGLQAGAGLDALFLTFDIRYQIGLNNVIREVQTASWNSKNNVWVISLGFKLL